MHLPRIAGVLGLLVSAVAPPLAAAPLKTPDEMTQVMLIRNVLTAVNQGNITGNFTVLRDLGSPRFRQKHSAADLGTLFATLREAKLDLSPILVIHPQLVQPAQMDEFRGRLRLVGYFPTKPQSVRFVLVFQHGNAGWGIDDISVALNANQQNASADQPRRVPPPAGGPSYYDSHIPRPAAFAR